MLVTGAQRRNARYWPITKVVKSGQTLWRRSNIRRACGALDYPHHPYRIHDGAEIAFTDHPSPPPRNDQRSQSQAIANMQRSGAKANAIMSATLQCKPRYNVSS
eukprot:1128394-Prymnesium_polylepis.1